MQRKHPRLLASFHLNIEQVLKTWDDIANCIDRKQLIPHFRQAFSKFLPVANCLELALICAACIA